MADVSPTRHDIYTPRLPSPPRTIISPPVLRSDMRITGIDTTPNSIFSNIDPDTIFHRAESLDWTYPNRHTAQEVLSFLWLGPHAIGKDPSFLRENAFTLVLAVRNAPRPGAPASTVQPAAVRAANSLGIQTHTMDVPTNGNAHLAPCFPPAIRTINAHLARHRAATGQLGRVLLTCGSGNDRAAAIAVAYLMEISDLSLEACVRVVQNQRFCISLGEELKWGLRGFEDNLRARRDVARAIGEGGGGAAAAAGFGLGFGVRDQVKAATRRRDDLQCAWEGKRPPKPKKRSREVFAREEEEEEDEPDAMTIDGCGPIGLDQDGEQRRFEPFA